MTQSPPPSTVPIIPTFLYAMDHPSPEPQTAQPSLHALPSFSAPVWGTQVQQRPQLSSPTPSLLISLFNNETFSLQEVQTELIPRTEPTDETSVTTDLQMNETTEVISSSVMMSSFLLLIMCCCIVSSSLLVSFISFFPLLCFMFFFLLTFSHLSLCFFQTFHLLIMSSFFSPCVLVLSFCFFLCLCFVFSLCVISSPCFHLSCRTPVFRTVFFWNRKMFVLVCCLPLKLLFSCL